MVVSNKRENESFFAKMTTFLEKEEFLKKSKMKGSNFKTCKLSKIYFSMIGQIHKPYKKFRHCLQITYFNIYISELNVKSPISI